MEPHLCFVYVPTRHGQTHLYLLVKDYLHIHYGILHQTQFSLYEPLHLTAKGEDDKHTAVFVQVTRSQPYG